MHTCCQDDYRAPCGAEFSAPFAGANGQGSHHLVEAMKNAFAMRMQLGDPGPGNSFLNLDAVLADMLSTQFASQLRWVVHACWSTAYLHASATCIHVVQLVVKPAVIRLHLQALAMPWGMCDPLRFMIEWSPLHYVKAGAHGCMLFTEETESSKASILGLLLQTLLQGPPCLHAKPDGFFPILVRPKHLPMQCKCSEKSKQCT